MLTARTNSIAHLSVLAFPGFPAELNDPVGARPNNKSGSNCLRLSHTGTVWRCLGFTFQFAIAALLIPVPRSALFTEGGVNAAGKGGGVNGSNT